MKKGVRIALAAAIVVAFFVGQQVMHAHKKSASGKVTDVPARPVQVKAEPRVWTRGSLTFTPCELGRPGTGASVAAWCAPFKVPENRADPNSRRIGLKLAVVRSDAAVPDPDMVTLLAGGPGEAATQSYVSVSPAFEALNKHHDILLLDQRGTGGSNPLTCKPASTPTPPDRTVVALDLDTLRKQVKQCLDQVEKKADPRFYTTTAAVADLEAVRQALGAPKLDLVGVSYGTRMAQQYAMHHPEGVRSIILDSPVPNTTILGADFAKNLEHALKLDFKRCTDTPACAKRFGDPYKTLYQLRDQLRANPHQVTIHDPSSYKSIQRMLSEDSLAAVVRMFAYEPETTALLPLTLDAAAHGDVGPLLGQARLISGDLDADMNNGMQMSVVCSEDADLLKPDPADANTILGNRLVQVIKAECDVWPHGTRPADFHQPLRGDIPTLVLSGQDDPVTPPRYGRAIVADLDHARQLVLKGQGHAELMRGCVPRLMKDFIDTPDPKKLDASCLKVLQPIPAYVNFNGATP